MQLGCFRLQLAGKDLLAACHLLLMCDDVNEVGNASAANGLQQPGGC